MRGYFVRSAMWTLVEVPIIYHLIETPFNTDMTLWDVETTVPLTSGWECHQLGFDLTNTALESNIHSQIWFLHRYLSSPPYQSIRGVNPFVSQSQLFNFRIILITHRRGTSREQSGQNASVTVSRSP